VVSSLTSDRDYLEIVANGNTTVSATSVGGDADGVFPRTVDYGSYSGGVTITHNIGEVPIVRGFFDSAKNGRLYNTIRWSSGSSYLADKAAPLLITQSTTTTTRLIINAQSSVTGVPVYYRIYRFGTKGVTSDASIDKIFGKRSDAQTVSTAVSSSDPVEVTATIPHGQAEKIFWTLEFSDDQINWYREGAPVFGAPDTGSGPPGGPYANYYYFVAYGSSDATNFYVTYVHNYSTSKTIYTRFTWDYIN
jgi:hypothetical protein